MLVKVAVVLAVGADAVAVVVDKPFTNYQMARRRTPACDGSKRVRSMQVEASEKFASKDLSVLLLGSSARNQNSIFGDGQPSIPNSA